MNQGEKPLPLEAGAGKHRGATGRGWKMDIHMETMRRRTWEYFFSLDKWSVKEIIALVVCNRTPCHNCNAPASYIRKECKISAAQRLAFLLQRSDIYNVEDGENISPHDTVSPRAFIQWALALPNSVIQLPQEMLDWYHKQPKAAPAAIPAPQPPAGQESHGVDAAQAEVEPTNAQEQPLVLPYAKRHMHRGNGAIEQVNAARKNGQAGLCIYCPKTGVNPWRLQGDSHIVCEAR